VTAVAGGELAIGQRHDALQLPPVLLFQGEAAVALRIGGLRVKLGEGRVDGGDIAAVAVQKIQLLEAREAEAAAPVADHRHEGRGAQRDGAGEAQVVLRHADVEGRRDQQVGVLALRLVGDDLGAEPVGAQEAGRPVLLVGADGDHHRLRALQVVLDLLPGREVQQHGKASLNRVSGIGLRKPRG
jgi:hypothetical protein